LVVISSAVLASPPLASKEQIGMFRNSKTCVVLDNGSISAGLYNSLVKDAIQKYWKLTTYEFIDEQEFDKRRFDSKYSFLVRTKVAFGRDPAGVSYDYISLVMGDTAKDLTNMPELCSIPLSYSNDNNVKYEYVMPYIIKFIQKHVEKLRQNRSWFLLQGLKYYNSSSGFKNKVLLLNKETMATNADTQEKIKTVYPYQFKLLSVSEIKKEVASNPANTLFNFHIGPMQESEVGQCFEMIFDAEGNLYYYNYRKITNDNTDGFNLNDLSRIKKQ
jgi:hypothetical protein